MKLKVRKESEAGQKEARIKFLDTPIMSLIMSPKTFIISKDEIKAEYDEGYDRMQQTAKEEVNSLFKFQRYTLFHLRPTSSFLSIIVIERNSLLFNMYT